MSTNPGTDRRSFLPLLAAVVALTVCDLPAQFRLSGLLGTGFRYTRVRSGDHVSWVREWQTDFNLHFSGAILDPRLATFRLTGALSPNDVNSSQIGGFEDTRMFSFNGHLSVLPTTNYPLEIRFTRSRVDRSIDTDVTGLGVNWRVAREGLPTFFLKLDHLRIQSGGQFKSDKSYTTGTIRAVKQMGRTDMDGEFGLQKINDDLFARSRTRKFGRFGSTTIFSPTTSVRVIGNFLQQDTNSTYGAGASLLNRPDPDTSASLFARISRTSARILARPTLFDFQLSPSDVSTGNLSRSDPWGPGLSTASLTGNTLPQIGPRLQEDQDLLFEEADTILEINGAYSKAFHFSDTFSITPFTTSLINRRYNTGIRGDSGLVNVGGGVAVATRHFNFDYGLGLTYLNIEDIGTDRGTFHQFHVGSSRQLTRTLRMAGDYTLTQERTFNDRNRQWLSFRTEGRLTRALFLRAYAEIFDDDSSFLSAEERVFTFQKTFSVGANVSYAYSSRLNFNMGFARQRLRRPDTPSWLTRIVGDAVYRVTNRLMMTFGAMREIDTLNHFSRLETLTRISYRLGVTTLHLDYRYETNVRFDLPGSRHAFFVRIDRPFSLRF